MQVLAELSPAALPLAETALRAMPAEPALLVAVALAALIARQPDPAITVLKRFERKYEVDEDTTLLSALSLCRQGYVAHALRLLEQVPPEAAFTLVREFGGSYRLLQWLNAERQALRPAVRRAVPVGRPSAKRAASATSPARNPAAATGKAATGPASLARTRTKVVTTAGPRRRPRCRTCRGWRWPWT